MPYVNIALFLTSARWEFQQQVFQMFIHSLVIFVVLMRSNSEMHFGAWFEFSFIFQMKCHGCVHGGRHCVMAASMQVAIVSWRHPLVAAIALFNCELFFNWAKCHYFNKGGSLRSWSIKARVRAGGFNRRLSFTSACGLLVARRNLFREFLIAEINC